MHAGNLENKREAKEFLLRATSNNRFWKRILYCRSELDNLLV